MIWTAALAIGIGLLGAAAAARAESRRRQQATLAESRESRRVGADRALLVEPRIDLSKCFGCGACVSACPEEGVLGLLHGQAAVVRGANCVGHAACEAACPSGAIVVSLGNLAQRDDVPVLGPTGEALGQPGVFVAGEASAKALIQPALEQGAAVAAEVAARRGSGRLPRAPIDLLVVGAGPAGLAAMLEARRLNLAVRWIDREPEPGGTVARYPRRKLVLTRPLELPGYARSSATEYTKEQLVALWERVVRERGLPFEGQVELHGLERIEHGALRADTSAGAIEAAAVCLAVGRRGTPRRLGVPGEGLPKVAYRLEDAEAYRGREILVVGGGDSAVEAALALCEHNRVALSYRRAGFFRLRSRNQARLEAARAAGRLELLLGSELLAIEPERVLLRLSGAGEPAWRPNQELFLFLGGSAPKQLLERCLVPFDGRLRPPELRANTAALPLSRSLFLVCLGSVAAGLFALGQRGYYGLPLGHRPGHPDHDWLRPGAGLGLGLGILSAALIAANLAYLWRRSRGPRQRLSGLRLGSLQGWLSAHVATGLLALQCALLHAALAPRATVGGDALWLLLGLCLTGAIGRAAYARVPRAANGRELALGELEGELERCLGDLGAEAGPFAQRTRQRFDQLVDACRWGAPRAGDRRGPSAPWALLRSWWQQRAHTRRALAELSAEARAAGLASEPRRRTLELFARAAELSGQARDLERWRALLGLWRYLHRWSALLLVLLLLAHVVSALRFGIRFEGARTLEDLSGPPAAQASP